MGSFLLLPKRLLNKRAPEVLFLGFRQSSGLSCEEGPWKKLNVGLYLLLEAREASLFFLLSHVELES